MSITKSRSKIFFSNPESLFSDLRTKFSMYRFSKKFMFVPYRYLGFLLADCNIWAGQFSIFNVEHASRFGSGIEEKIGIQICHSEKPMVHNCFP